MSCSLANLASPQAVFKTFELWKVKQCGVCLHVHKDQLNRTGFFKYKQFFFLSLLNITSLQNLFLLSPTLLKVLFYSTHLFNKYSISESVFPLMLNSDVPAKLRKVEVFHRIHRITEWFGLEGTFKGHPVQPLPWAGTSSTGWGHSEPGPAWPWTFAGMGHPPPRWATCARASPPSV